MRLDQLPTEVLERIIKDVLDLNTGQHVGWISILDGDSPGYLYLSRVNQVIRQCCIRVAQKSAPLNLSITKDIGSIRRLIDTFPSSSIYFDQTKQVVYEWENWEASELKWSSDPKGGPLDHAFIPRRDWQYAQAIKELEDEESDEDKDMDPVERVFGEGAYTNGPDAATDEFGDISEVSGSTPGAVPGISSIQDVERTLRDVFRLCTSLRWLHWSATLYPLPKGLASALDGVGILDTLILSNEMYHWELELSAIPRCTCNLFFCYAPMIHDSCQPKDKDSTPWLQYSEKAPLGVEIIESKAPQVINPPPLDDSNKNHLNAWIIKTRNERLLYWLCESIINGLAINLRVVGLLSSKPLQIPSMLPVWLCLDKVIHAQESGIDFFPDQLTDSEEVSQRCQAINEIREELHFKDIARALTEDEIRRWAKEESGKAMQNTSYRHEMAEWIVKDDELCAAIATAKKNQKEMTLN